MGFSDPIVADSTLVRGAIHSTNYAPGAAGWNIESSGDAEFGNLTARTSDGLPLDLIKWIAWQSSQLRTTGGTKTFTPFVPLVINSSTPNPIVSSSMLFNSVANPFADDQLVYQFDVNAELDFTAPATFSTQELRVELVITYAGGVAYTFVNDSTIAWVAGTVGERITLYKSILVEFGTFGGPPLTGSVTWELNAYLAGPGSGAAYRVLTGTSVTRRIVGSGHYG